MVLTVRGRMLVRLDGFLVYGGVWGLGVGVSLGALLCWVFAGGILVGVGVWLCLGWLGYEL